ncbi:MAG: glycosyl hydrolase [Phycisphaeraceae bacterium]|nr:MAG: glycosyl hydrolase [Phycisphaeraceae bacterium]
MWIRARIVARAVFAAVLFAPAAMAQDVASPVDTGKSRIKASLFSALTPRSIGPAIMSGRVGDLAVSPRSDSEFYVAVASGNLWKTTDGGTTFAPVFDAYGSYSIGCVAIDPSNPAVVWVGTGENNSQRSVGWGDGVYVSRDAGKSFTNVGLGQSEHVGMISIDPRDSNTVYVAAMGPLWRSGGDRGVYKTTDGGATWARVLHVSDDTGFNEVHFDPRDRNVLYATAYQRRRHVWTLINGGPESAIYKSTDAGRSWRKVTSGLPSEDKGRIGLAISPANPDVLYAIVESVGDAGGIFRSTDRGETWQRRSGYMSSSPQYYNELVPHPTNPDRVYSLDTFLNMSDDGGATWKSVHGRAVHVDCHAMWINPKDPSHHRLGTDGGLYETFDSGGTYRFVPNLPVKQFYRVSADNSTPFYYVYGGTQDNNTVGGPSRTTERMGIANEDWFVTAFGDGFEPAIDPEDPTIVYSQSQHLGLVRYDRKTGEEVDIKPMEKPGEAPNKWNWDTPLIISPHAPRRLYVAGNYLYRSDDRGDSWRRVSGDLTRGIDRNQLKVMGRIQPPDAVAKHRSTSLYGNSISLTESPRVEGLIYVGTDDGLVHVTEDGGAKWRRVENFPVVPESTYVSDLDASRHQADTVYACFNNHKNGDFTPYVLRSDDRGRSWRSIAGDLPKGHAVHTLVEDHVNPDLLFVGTEFACFVTLDGGKAWMKLPGLPTIAVRDLEIQRRENDLVIGTFGRGIYILDDYTPLRAVSEEMLGRPAAIFPIKTALAYVERSRLGGRDGKGWAGQTLYAAKNPPAGAVITYHLRDKPKTLKEKRREAEKKPDAPYPTIDQFRAEDREAEPQVFVTIRDDRGNVVRRLPASRSEGMHRIVWDLRYAETTAVTLSASSRMPWDTSDRGVLALPGAYTATISQTVDGVTTDLAGPEPFRVEDLVQSERAATGEARAKKHEFERKAAELQRALDGVNRVVGDAQGRLAFLRKAVLETPGADHAILADLESLRLKLLDVQTELRGDSTRDNRFEPRDPSISDRVGFAVYGSRFTTQPPTPAQVEQYGHAADAFERVLSTVRALIETDLRGIESRLESAGAPYTPGRLPEWKR